MFSRKPVRATYQLKQIKLVNLRVHVQRGQRLYTSESDVCRRQILTYKHGARTRRNKIFIMAVDPLHRYTNEAYIAN